MSLYTAMKKFNLIIILFFSLLGLRVHYEPNCLERNITTQNIGGNELSFETNEGYNYLTGILPSAHVFFNIVPETPSSLSTSEKIKDTFGKLITSKTKIIFNLSFHQDSVFNRYSSAFIQIYLKTACFRL
jgi:hypothetical protein